MKKNNSQQDFSEYGLVIQGPLESIGRSGASAYKTLSDFYAKENLPFDCSDYIKKYVQNYPKLKIVFATWESDKLPKFRRIMESNLNFKLISFTDSLDNISLHGTHFPNNKYRQMFLTLQGAEYLSQIGIKYIIKVRSDQLMDIEDLILDFKKAKSLRSFQVMIPFGFPNLPDYIEDFFFVSTAEHTIHVAKKYMESKELFESAHNDYFYAWASDQFQAIPRPIIKLLRVTPFLRKCYFNSWKKTFCPASYRTLDGLFWRGEKFAAEIPKSNGGFFLNRNPKKKEMLYPNLKYRKLSRWLLNMLKKVNYRKEAKSLNGI